MFVSEAKGYSLRIQNILYNTQLLHVERMLEYMNNTIRVARESKILEYAEVAIGDCSSNPCIDPTLLRVLRQRCTHISSIEYTFFDSNLGHGGGQNRLMASAS